jgi:ABC-type transport system substrate-binding protein
MEKLKKKLQAFLPEKSPSLGQIKQISKVLDKKERAVFQISLTFLVVSLTILVFSLYYQKTESVPAFGGKYSEGIIGYPQLLNPIYSSANDVDRDITQILFSGIVKQDSLGEIVPGLAQEISAQGKVFEVTLKENLRWSDGEELTSDDIVFTVETIQNPKARSPLRPDWIGVKVEKVSDLTVRFHLEQPSAIFPNRLFLQLIPRHIWKEVSLENLPLSGHNLNPVGSGPYRIKSVKKNHWEKIESLTLEINPFYYGNRPNIEEISFFFFDDISNLLFASKRNTIHGFAVINPKDYQEIIKETRFIENVFQMPRVFSLFFNLESEKALLKDKEFRQALSFAIDKEEILREVLNSRGQIINSLTLLEIYQPDFEETHEFNLEKSNDILDNLGLKLNENNFREKLLQEEKTFEFKKDLNTSSQGEEVRELQRCLIENEFYQGEITGFYGAETKEAVVLFQEKYREEILDPSGFSKGTGMVAKSTRAKLNELCQFVPKMTSEISLTITTVNQPLMSLTAQKIKEQWSKLGINVEVSLLEISSLENEAIKPRNYEILLFGKAFDSTPDYFPFWHSSQKTEYGFNLSMYSNEKVDQELEDYRKEIDPEKRMEKAFWFNNFLSDDLPAIFLFNPDFILFTSKKIKGVEKGLVFNPSQRFRNIENWYIKTKRVKK